MIEDQFTLGFLFGFWIGFGIPLIVIGIKRIFNDKETP